MSFVFPVHFSLLLFTTSFPLTIGVSLYEKVQLLETSYADIKEVLECKVLNLETKVIALEAKIAALEEKAEHQESVLTTLQNEQENTTPMAPDSVEIDHPIVKNNPIFRTCYEMNEANPLLDSGMYWIDPDGKGIGDDAFTVYCNMTSGSTLIFHDTEPKTDVGHCAGRGCYSRKVNYGASNRQVAALIALSEECQQSITVNFMSLTCFNPQINLCSLTTLIQTFSTIASVPHCNSTVSTFRGGTTRTENRNTFGLETTKAYTLVNAELIEIVSNLISRAIVTPFFRNL
ncbi:hypothetical protein OUZ56_015350 [Daphnia magna]|uniref:Fibrillar collagen NC1 domain-containing protein n=1 Tax=Daphnia magna TaxID=35525 RepID=A0ABR0AMJ8_9CRUS|nr:hypothetical protein OUZ56_015350 [Daphnia magna]